MNLLQFSNRTDIPDNVTVHQFGSGAELRAQGYRLAMAVDGTLDDVLDMACPGEGVAVAITYGAEYAHRPGISQFFISVRMGTVGPNG